MYTNYAAFRGIKLHNEFVRSYRGKHRAKRSFFCGSAEALISKFAQMEFASTFRKLKDRYVLFVEFRVESDPRFTVYCPNGKKAKRARIVAWQPRVPSGEYQDGRTVVAVQSYDARKKRWV